MSDPHKKRKRSQETKGSEDFEKLAQKYPDFARELQSVRDKQTESGGSFSSVVTQEFNIALTRAWIHSKFAVRLPSLPLDRLCPPVPNRLAYVQWLQSTLLPLLSESNDYFDDTGPLTYRGLDIGTGASCIYPILFTCNNDEWNMVGTEIDAVSMESARANLKANQLESRVTLHLVQPTRVQQQQHAELNLADSDGPIARAFDCCDEGSTFDFIMTNPPFFDSSQAIAPRGDNRERTPMTEYEGTYPGGEVGFVDDMIRDSFLFGDRLGWYSTMCGKKSSFQRLKHILQHLLGPGHVFTMEHSPGYMTRWFIAWTFRRPKSASPLARVKRKSLSFTLDSDEPDVVDVVVSRINVYCETFPGWKLSTTVSSIDNGKLVRIVEDRAAAGQATNEAAEAQLPERLFDVVYQDWNIDRYLPEDDHFRVEIAVTEKQPRQGSVCVECFDHSQRGAKATEKIRSKLQGEVCRTNRRWRRLLKRQAEETKNLVVDQGNIQ